MSLIKEWIVSRRRKRGHVSGQTAITNLLAIFIVASSVRLAVAQIGLVDRSLGQQPVSKNQLLVPGKALKAINRAHEDLSRGNLASAQKELARALEIAPDCAVALSLQGTLDLQMDQPGRAAESFQEAIHNDPALAGAYLGLATTLLSEGRFKDALTPLHRATGLLPASWFIHIQTALAQLGLGNTEAALKEVDFAERLTGTEPEGRSGVSYLHAMVSAEMKDSAGTRKYLADTITRAPHGYYAELAKRWLERLQAGNVEVTRSASLQAIR